MFQYGKKEREGGKKGVGRKGGDKRMEGMTGRRFKAGTGKKKRK